MRHCVVACCVVLHCVVSCAIVCFGIFCVQGLAMLVGCLWRKSGGGLFGVFANYVLVSMLNGSSANAVIESALVILKPYSMFMMMFWFSKSVSFSAVTLISWPIAVNVPLKSCVLVMTWVSTVQRRGSMMVSCPVVVFRTSMFLTRATTVPLISTVVALASSFFSMSSLVRLSLCSCSSSSLISPNSWSVRPRVMGEQLSDCRLSNRESSLWSSWVALVWLLMTPMTVAPRRRIRIADISAAVVLLLMYDSPLSNIHGSCS